MITKSAENEKSMMKLFNRAIMFTLSYATRNGTSENIFAHFLTQKVIKCKGGETFYLMSK